MLANCLGKDLVVANWKAWRGDKRPDQLPTATSFRSIWIGSRTASMDAWAYDRFVEAALAPKPEPPAATLAEQKPAAVEPTRGPLWRLRCSSSTSAAARTNCPAGATWTAKSILIKPLPFKDGEAAFIEAEHCVEHVPYKSAVAFFAECFRVLAPGGVVRIAVPSLEQIRRCENEDYFKFTQRWQRRGPSARGAMDAIIHAQARPRGRLWNATLLDGDSLFFAGFEHLKDLQAGRKRTSRAQGRRGGHGARHREGVQRYRDHLRRGA